MGKLHTFYSPLHGQCKTTASMVAMAYYMPDCVLLHTQPRFADLENMFNSRMKNPDDLYSKIGISNLCYEIKAGALSEKDIRNNAKALTDNLCLLPSSVRNNTDEDREEILRYIVTEDLPRYFKNVCVDLGSGSSPLIQAIQEKADTNYIVLSQNQAILKPFEDIPNRAVVVGGYDPNRKLGVSYYKQIYRCPVYTVPYSPEYADAISSGRVLKFFSANEFLLETTGKRKRDQKAERLYEFFSSIPRWEKENSQA